MPDLHGKTFRTWTNSGNGEVDAQTLFHYSERNGIIHADYSGGQILLGHMIGKRTSEHDFEMSYHHMSLDGSIKTGVCRSRMEIGEDGKLRIKEKWKWTCGDGSEGESEIREV